METKTTAQKIIFFLLDLFLIVGAIVGILSIDGGQWLISNPAFYQPPEEAVQENGLIPVSGASAGAESGAKNLSKTGEGCPADPQYAGPEY